MEQYSNSATRQLVNAGSGIGRWIGACLDSLAEDLAGAGQRSRDHHATVEVTASGARVVLRGKPAATIEGNASPAEVAGLASKVLHGRARKDVLLRLTGGKTVRQRITLPAAAQDVLPAVIRNKVESLAPWPLAEVLWGYRVAEPPAPGQIAADVGIVSRKLVDGFMNALASVGLRVQAIEIGDAPGGAIAIDTAGPRRSQGYRRAIDAGLALAGFSALAIGGVGAYLAYGTQRELSALDRQYTELRQSLLSRSGAAAGDARLAAANAAHDRKRSGVAVVAMLNDLTRQVPDGTWLTGIDYEDGRLTIAGKGRDVDKVIGSLDSSDVFSEVNFASATQRDADLGADSFVISATVAAAKAQP